MIEKDLRLQPLNEPIHNAYGLAIPAPQSGEQHLERFKPERCPKCFYGDCMAETCGCECHKRYFSPAPSGEAQRMPTPEEAIAAIALHLKCENNIVEIFSAIDALRRSESPSGEAKLQIIVALEKAIENAPVSAPEPKDGAWGNEDDAEYQGWKCGAFSIAEEVRKVIAALRRSEEANPKK